MSGQETVGLLWRRSTVEAQTGLSRAEIYRRMKLGTFPKPVKIGARIVAWDPEVIKAWVKSLARQS